MLAANHAFVVYIKDTAGDNTFTLSIWNFAPLEVKETVIEQGNLLRNNRLPLTDVDRLYMLER